jgi:4-amino-4-deoxy-L-arabinose transferase-like glycosyltransferase
LDFQVVLNQILAKGVDVGSKKKQKIQITQTIDSPEAKRSGGKFDPLDSDGLDWSRLRRSRAIEWLAISAWCVVALWFLSSRIQGVTVSVLIDEYSYVLDAHYSSLADARYPNYLFQLIFSTTQYCGVEFYSCARNINALFVVASALVVYVLAKYIGGKIWLGALAATGVVAGSTGTYVAYFMPDALFNFLMVLFFALLFRFSKSESLLTWVGLGTLLGLASLAKPHAFFVIPALVIFIFLSTRASGDRYLLRTTLRLVSAGAALLVSKFAIGAYIAGQKAVTVFGTYGAAIESPEAVATTLGADTWANVPQTAWGQTLMITMILGLSLPVAITSVLGTLRNNPSKFNSNSFRVLFGWSLLNMMAVTALFEAWLNLNIWMHTRYSTYLLPLALIVLIEAYKSAPAKGINYIQDKQRLINFWVVGVFTLLAVIALVTAAMPFGANWVDAPDFKAHIDNPALSSIAILASIVLAFWWLWDEKKAVAFGLVVAVIAATLSGAYITKFLKEQFGMDTLYDQVGRVLKDFLPQDELDKTLLVGPTGFGLEKSLFNSMTGQASYRVVSDPEFSISEIGPEIRWVVATEDVIVSELPKPTIQGFGFALYSLDPNNSFVPRINDIESVSDNCSVGKDNFSICSSGATIKLIRSLNSGSGIDLILQVPDDIETLAVSFAIEGSTVTQELKSGLNVVNLILPSSVEADSIEITFPSGLPQTEQGANGLRVISAVIAPKYG